MSNSESETAEIKYEGPGAYYAPRKFIFDVPGDKTKPNIPNEAKKIRKTLEVEQYMPFIFNFPEPKDLKESYSSLIKNILNVYNHVRLLVGEVSCELDSNSNITQKEYYEEMKHIIKEFKIEQPNDCLGVLKELLTGCFEKLQTRPKDLNETPESDPVKDYETLLQKAEAKIRILIRNEQIFRLNFDILTQKIEDAEKSFQIARHEIETHKSNQEILKKENSDLATKIKQKDEELKKLQKEREELHKKLTEMQIYSANIEKADQTALKNPGKNIPPQWNYQTLNTLLKENNHTPREGTKFTSNADGKSDWNSIGQASMSKYPSAEKKNEHKANIPTTGSFLTASSGIIRRGQSDRSKNSLLEELKKNIDSHRAGIEASLEVMLNKSSERSQERSSLSGAAITSHKRGSHHLKQDYSQDEIRAKTPIRDRSLEGSSERNQRSSFLTKSSIQKIVLVNNKYGGNSSVRPTSTGKSRESLFVPKSRVIQTEQSPSERSQNSRMSYNYASNQKGDPFNKLYAESSKKSFEVKDTRSQSQSKASNKSSFLIKSMIAEQLSKKLSK